MLLLEVRTGCRLHFGLLELAEGHPLRFGGLGLMLDQPGWHLQFSSQSIDPRATCGDRASSDFESDQPTVGGHPVPGASTAAEDEVAKRIARVLNSASNTQVHVARALPLHSGLGAGTQLAAALVAGQLLDQLARQPFAQQSWDESGSASAASKWQSISRTLPQLDARQLASLSGRGLRSAVGLQGFLCGGLILDEGYHATGAPRPIHTQRLTLPEAWRVVLVRPTDFTGVSGDQESQLLDNIAQAENPHRDEMHSIANKVMSDIAHSIQPDFTSVMQQLEAYMRLAGALFAEQQGGLYNGPAVATAAAQASRAGLYGVGQSSWGPTVFGFCPDEQSAQVIAEQLRQLPQQYAITIAHPTAHGAQWRVRSKE